MGTRVRRFGDREMHKQLQFESRVALTARRTGDHEVLL